MKAAEFDPGALADMSEASDWYAREAGEDVSVRFEVAVTEAVTRAARTPIAYARLPDQDGARRVLVREFPYSVIFVLRAGSVVVVAVSHVAREPGYWRDRL